MIKLLINVERIEIVSLHMLNLAALHIVAIAYAKTGIKPQT